MPSVLDQKFIHKFYLPSAVYQDVKTYCENTIGYRTYVLSSRVGGKKWYIEYPRSNGEFCVSVDCNSHAIFLALKYGAQTTNL